MSEPVRIGRTIHRHHPALPISRRRLVAAAGGALVACYRTGRGGGAMAQDGFAAQSPSSRYFALTGHNLGEPFRSRWDAAGGEAVLGLPRSEERYAPGAGGVLQTFDGLTLVYDAGQPAPFDVRGHPFDKTAWLDLAPRESLIGVAGCSRADPTCTYFAETGHTLAGEFASFWYRVGGEALVGPPISEPFRDPKQPGVTAQLFAAAMLEASPAAGVRLRPQNTGDAASGDPAFRPAPPNGGTPFQVASPEGLRLRKAPSLDGEMLTVLEKNSEFIAAQERDGDWLPGYADGRSGWVSASYLIEPPPLPMLDVADWNPAVWQGAALSDANVRTEPTSSARLVRELRQGDRVTVVAWVRGEEVFPAADMWAQLDAGGFVYGRNVGRNAPLLPTPLPPDTPSSGRWIDLNLTQQLVNAYDGQTAVRTVPTTTGMPGWETPEGWFAILNRVANETMTSGAIGAENFYKLEDVLFTQYFTERGHALHFAWWRTKETIGRPGSHGCVNLMLEDARFFWDFATVGTPVIVHR